MGFLVKRVPSAFVGARFRLAFFIHSWGQWLPASVYGHGEGNFGLFLLPLCAFGCYATYTRLVMFGFILATITVFLMSRKGLARFSLLLPIFVIGLCRVTHRAGDQNRGGCGTK